MTEPLALRPGDTFAEGFRIVRALEKSEGASALFAAVQSLTGRACLLRVLHPRIVADKDGRARFEAACRVRAGIESDHVIQLLAAGVDAASGSPWFALERLEGRSLADWLARGPRATDDPAEALDLVGQLGAAFTAVRAAGETPGTLTPARVLVATSRHQDGGLTLKLLDFWTADVVDGATPNATPAPTDRAPTDATPEGDAPSEKLSATLMWQASEVGDTPEGSAASDVWTLGLLAFHLLVGRPYWKALARPKARAKAKPPAPSLAREVASETHDPASARARALGFRRPLPEGFDDWFARCVAHDPSDRFADPAEATEALRALLEGEPEAPDSGEDEVDDPEETETEPEAAAPPPPRKVQQRSRLAPERDPDPDPDPEAAKPEALRLPLGLSQDIAVPLGLAVALVVALGVRALVFHRRAAHAPAQATATAPATTQNR